FEATELFLAGDVHPEFDDDGAVVGELLFEVVELAVGALPFIGPAEALEAFDEHAAIPGAVEDGDEAVTGDLPPEAPKVVEVFFLVGGFADGDDAAVAHVDGAGEAADGTAFAGGVPALEDEDDR